MRLPLASLALLSLAAAPALADGMKPYLRTTLGLDWSRNATFEDADCAAPDALYGCVDGENGKPIGAYGDFGATTLLGLGAGLEITDWLRAEANLDIRPNLDFDGNANFLSAGRDQPVSGKVTQADLMAMAYVEPLAAMGVETKVRPFLGIGAGVSRNEIGEMTYYFPALRQPRYTYMPGGTRYDFAWTATAGLGYQVSDHVTLELAWRYSDLGKIETEAGTMVVQRYSGIKTYAIGKTEADLTTQSVTVSARFGL